MRIFNKYAYMGAIALVGAVGFTACSSEDDLTAQQNPTFDGESVKTQFAINIPYGGGNGTRMSATNTQQVTGSFLGMQNIKLLPLKAEAADNDALVQIISLGNIENSGLTDQHKIYTDVNIPVGTTHFLFYGEALGTQTTSTKDAFAQGVLNNTIAGSANTNSITFSLLPVTTNMGNVESASKQAVLDAVNGVASADGWKAYATEGTNTNKLLTNLYTEFTTNFPAGSAASVKLALTDLKNAIAELVASTGTTEKTVADAINAKITEAIGDDGNGGTLKDNIYPTDFNLPVGAAQLKWDNGVASWVNSASLGETNAVSLDMAKVCYPASLSYFVSTDLKSTNNGNNPSWPSYNDWKDGSWDGEWNGTSVTATTQAIALTKPIQYGVALLQSSVKCKTPTLEDNAATKGGETQNRFITVPSTGFPVTGLLVGGQPDALKWNFKPASDGDRTMTIYDKSVSDVTAGYNLSTTTTNYTLVLENTKTSGDADKVNVAIELTNNSGGDFYGADGVIKDGATFYLVGQLDMAKLNTGDNPNSLTSVFEQDYTTVATFTISSLKNAYNCIPDLRGTQLSLGLAVDLQWKTGVNFDVTID